MKNIAIILANGSGERAGFYQPKQMVRLAGRPIIIWAIDAFIKNKNIEEIYVSTNARVWNVIKANYSEKLLKKIKFVEGGSNRNESTKNALKYVKSFLEGMDCKILIHDAVRPLVDQRIINDSLEALDIYDAIDVVVPASDTIVASSDGITVSDVLDRSKLRYGQTPQGFKISILDRAYKIAEMAGDEHFTDDCGVVRRYLPKTDIGLVSGGLFNSKLTYKEDLFLLEKTLQLKLGESANFIPDSLNSYFQGKVIVVVGAFTGIGLALVNLLTSLGAKVISESRRTGFDLHDFSSFQRRLECIYKENSRIDSIICSSGILEKGPLLSMSDDSIVEQIMLNLASPLVLGKYAHQYLSETNGCLVYFTSSSYTLGREYYAPYSSSKAGVVNFVQALADEWAHDGIRVLAICPERTKTELREKAFGEEPADSLLSAEVVASETVNAIVSGQSGVVVEIRRTNA